MRVLAIESSCDETAVAIVRDKSGHLDLQKNKIYSQAQLHSQYGGVVPEVAARKHVETLVPLLDSVLGKNKLKDIDYLAVTAGPGLVASLLLGISAAKAMAFASAKPLLAINHIEGHVYSNWLSNKKLLRNESAFFPALVLVVSGGHTELILMTDHGNYSLVGQTVDDAVGEAYDKVAKLLDLGYPGGPIVSKLAKKGDASKYKFPRPMLDSGDYNFSLSGLKTAVLYTLEKKGQIKKSDIADICAAFQEAVIEVLVKKTELAAQQHMVKSIMLAGGVAANKVLQKSLKQSAQAIGIEFFSPKQEFSGDNAAMIAAAAYYQIKYKKAVVLKDRELFDLGPRANWQLSQNKL